MTITATVLLIGFLVVIAAYLAYFLIHPGPQAARLLRRAIQAVESRKYDEAIAFYDRADELRSKFRNPEANRSMGFAIEQGKGLCWLEKNYFNDAQRHLRRAVELLDQGVEMEHRVIVHLYCYLAIALFGEGKEAEGEATLTKVDELCEAAKGDQIEGIAEWLVGAAAGASSRNQYQLAFRLACRAISMLSKTDAWHKGQWAQAQVHLASIHMLVGEYRRARELIEYAIESLEEGQLDEEDHDNALFYLGELELIAGDCRKAIDCLQKCVEIRQQAHGPDHRHTSIAVGALATVYRAYGDYQQAETCFRETLRVQAEQLSKYDSILIGTKIQMALLLCDLGQYDESDELLKDAEAVPVEVAKVMGNTLPAMRLIRGMWHLDRLQLDPAFRCVEESLRLAQAIYGESHILTGDFRQILGDALVRAGRLEEAERLLRETLAIREVAPDACKLDFADLLLIMAGLYLATDRASDAEAAARRAETMIAGLLLPTNLSLARLHAILAEALARQGHTFEAKTRIEQAQEIHRQVQPPDHPRLVRFCDNAQIVYQAAGDISAAERYRRQGDAIRSKFAAT